jgi:hypothetical protein
MEPRYKVLCEHCRQRTASIQVIVFSWPSGEQTEQLCELCYPESEAARIRAYITQPAPLPPLDVEHITASAYIAASTRAAANGPDKPLFRHISNELKRFPATRSRLAIELLTMAKHSLDQNDDAGSLIRMVAGFGDSIEPARLPEFIELLEAIIHRSLTLIAQSSLPPSRRMYGYGLDLAIMVMHRTDPSRLTAIRDKLAAQSENEGQRNYQNVLKYFEDRISKVGSKRKS